MASSLEVNKMLAALLTAGIVASGSGVISRIVYHPQIPQEAAYPIEVPAAGEATVEADGAGAPTVSLAALLADGSVEEGQTVAKKCVACHSFEQGGPNKIGPALWGVLGRDIASHEGFAYSDALASREGAWDYESLNAFVGNPKEWAPGTKMAFAGLGKPEDRANVILYLRSLSDSSPALPEVPAEEPAAATTEVAATQEAAPETESGDAPAASLSALLASASAERGQQGTRVCSACHSFDQGGPNKIGPALWGVLGRDIASHEGFSYSSALSDKEGAWDYETLNTYLTDPRSWAPGTKMAFAGIKKPEDRADMILYLRSLAASPEPLPEGG
jgi:cytochrome c